MEGSYDIVDAHTIEAAKTGDREAVAALWRTYQPQLLRFLRARRAMAPDDVASQVWIDVGRALGEFEGDGVAFQRWIFTIGRRRTIDEARRTNRRREVLDDGRDELPHCSDSNAAFDETGSLDRALELVRSLPTNMAEAVMLRVVYDLPVNHVAAMLGCTEGNVRVLVHRGLHRLGESLTPTELAHR